MKGGEDVKRRDYRKKKEQAKYLDSAAKLGIATALINLVAKRNEIEMNKLLKKLNVILVILLIVSVINLILTIVGLF